MNAIPIRLLRKIGIAEGISFLFLLAIAMPLKYVYGLPLAVKYTGWAHGLLFVSYIGLAYYAKEVYQWPLSRFLLAFASAWLPLGTFFFDKKLSIEEKRIKQGMR
jgi:integral membrane protein